MSDMNMHEKSLNYINSRTETKKQSNSKVFWSVSDNIF